MLIILEDRFNLAPTFASILHLHNGNYTVVPRRGRTFPRDAIIYRYSATSRWVYLRILYRCQRINDRSIGHAANILTKGPKLGVPFSCKYFGNEAGSFNSAASFWVAGISATEDCEPCFRILAFRLMFLTLWFFSVLFASALSGEDVLPLHIEIQNKKAEDRHFIALCPEILLRIASNIYMWRSFESPRTKFYT